MVFGRRNSLRRFSPFVSLIASLDDGKLFV